jgi:trehalose-phosphatase
MRNSKSPFISINPQHPLLFLLDYDGTLTDFKKDPKRSLLAPATRTLLYRLQRKFPVVIVTGRYVDSLVQLSGLKKFPVIGTHGFEARNLPQSLRFASLLSEKRYQKEAASIWKAVNHLHQTFPGIHIEKKPFSSTLHYRGANFSNEEIKRLNKKFMGLCRQVITPKLWTFQTGKNMVEVMPKGFSKAKAVQSLLKKFPRHLPIYAGDDVADTAVLKVLGKRGVKIAVGNRIPKKNYDLRFKTPGHLVAWLKRFI